LRGESGLAVDGHGHGHGHGHGVRSTAHGATLASCFMPADTDKPAGCLQLAARPSKSGQAPRPNSASQFERYREPWAVNRGAVTVTVTVTVTVDQSPSKAV